MTTKDIRNMAFTVGVGLTLGKYVGNLIAGMINQASETIVKSYAKKGNTFCQGVCDEVGLNYDDENATEYASSSIGFKVNG